MASPNKAQLFQATYRDYFFQEAHYQVEAAASVDAKEISPNVFLFDDGSVLVIHNPSASHVTFDSMEAFRATSEKE